MKPTNIFYYLVAFALPILLFLVITNNTNEKYPAAVYAVCTILFLIAGLLSSSGFEPKGKLKWTLASVAFGIIYASGLVFLV